MTTSYTTQELHNQGLNQSILFYIGKSAKGNFEIIDLASPDDMWFHINGDSSAHVISGYSRPKTNQIHCETGCGFI